MNATHLGFYNTSSSRTHVRFQFSTHAAAGGNVAPNSAFEAADLRIYKAADGAAFSATQRSSANGITMTSPFDSLTGFHDVDIDLTDNTDAGFYAAGGFYSVVLAPDETVDGQTLTGVVLAYFEIGVPAVNVSQFGGTAGTFSSGRPEVNTTHAAGTAWGSGAITAASIATGAITAAKFAASAIDAAALAADAVTEIQSGLATAAALDAVDNFVDTEVAAIKTVVDAIQAKTDNLPSDPADESLIIAATDAIFGRLGAPAGASMSADIAAIKSQTAAIETDTAEIGAAGAGLTVLATQASVNTIDDFLDTEITAIKAKTDKLTFDADNALDANVQKINDVTITGDGAGTPFNV